MGIAQPLLRSSALLTLNEIAANLCAFFRNFILARVLTKSDFGVAATLAIVISLLEISGKMALGQQVVRARNGGQPDFVGTAHSVQFALGVLSSLLILALAVPFARALKVPELSWGIQLLVIVTICSAVNSLEPFTYVRNMAFGRLVTVDLVPQVLITLAAYPLAWWLRDFRALIWLLIGKAALSMVISHLVSAQRYHWSFRLDYFWEMVKFGSPLFVESFLMFGIFQGDRLLVATSYSMSDLGGYAVAASLAAMPGIAAWKIVGGVGLPVLAQVQDNRLAFEDRYALVAQVLALLGGWLALLMVFAGEDVVVALFGHKYEGTGTLAACLCCAQAIRIIRGAPTLAATAFGDTVCLLAMSAMRLSGLALAVPVVWKGGGLFWVAFAGLGGELLALGLGVYLTWKVRQVRISICALPTLFLVGTVGLAVLFKAWLHSVESPVWWLVVFGVSAVGFTVVFAGIFGESRSVLRQFALRIRWR